jgi:threonylcarbamoyladenosine tRNA methylthiotransferase MtaB
MQQEYKGKIRVAFHTLGCRVNQYETEAIKEAFIRAGSGIVAEFDVADVYVVNTCTVTGIADRKSRQYIRRMKALNPDALMVVTGCYAQVESETLAGLDEVDMVIGNDLKSTICDEVYAELDRRAGEDEHSPAYDVVPGGCTVKVLAYEGLREYDDLGIVVSGSTGMSKAYIKIEDGCNRFCSYCKIPYARGRVRSRDLDEIVSEARELIGKGFHELILTGINTALYGTEPGFDFDRTPGEEDMSGLEAVIRRIDMLEGDFRIRLSSLEPTVVNSSQVKNLIKYEKLCHHMHLSIQSGSDKTLRAMNRRYSRDDYLDIVRVLREADPLYGITTDIIVGFPGETDEDFADTLDMIREAEFARVHGFRFSPRKGTKAAGMKDTVGGTVKSDRINALIGVADTAARDFNTKNAGTLRTVLAEEREGRYVTGFTGNNIKAYIDDPDEEVVPGSLVKVKLLGIYKDGCLAETAGKGR